MIPRSVKCRVGIIIPDKPAIEGVKYQEPRSMPDNYQCPFSERDFQNPKSWVNIPHFERPANEPIKKKWWVAGLPWIPKAEIMKDEGAINVSNENEFIYRGHLNDLDEVRPSQQTAVQNLAMIHGIYGEAHKISNSVKTTRQQVFNDSLYRYVNEMDPQEHDLPLFKAQLMQDRTQHQNTFGVQSKIKVSQRNFNQPKSKSVKFKNRY